MMGPQRGVGRQRRSGSVVVLLLVLLIPLPSVAVEPPAADPRSIAKSLAEEVIDPSQAVEARAIVLTAGPARFRLEEGTIYPASPVAGRPRELIFLGRGTVTIDPPDETEGGQIELFTGSRDLDAEFQEAVFVVGDDAAAARLLAPVSDAAGRAPPQDASAVASPRPQPSPAAASASGQPGDRDSSQQSPRPGTGRRTRGPTGEEARGGESRSSDIVAPTPARAAVLWSAWKGGAERRLLDVDGAILRNALGEPAHSRYFAARVHTAELGDILYEVDPENVEAVTLGQFVPFEATGRDRKKMERFLRGEHEESRLVGLELEDLGRFDTWMSTTLAGEGRTIPAGGASVEPDRYTIDATVEKHAESIRGNARLGLRATRSCRAVDLRIGPDMQIDAVADGSGRDLFWLRARGRITVALATPLVPGEELVLLVKFSGSPFRELSPKVFSLSSTTTWYPHAGSHDRATYDVTLRWPKSYDLLATGTLQESGEGPSGSRWERRTLPIPSIGFTFELGAFTVKEIQAGHVRVTVAFDRESKWLTREIQEQLVDTSRDALVYFEELFGTFPMDELKVVTAPRLFSQGMLGFVTLSDLMIADLGVWGALAGQEDRRTVLAHEIAHQWWGARVGFESYRDVWLSEGMATYAALLYQRNRLKESGILRGPTTGWHRELERATKDGRPVESIGPVTLGERLSSSRSEDAYQSIVYRKGAVLLDMLSNAFPANKFQTMLGQISGEYAGKNLTTEEFFRAIEAMSGERLDWFVDQYVRGTGIPSVYYAYQIHPSAGGRWAIDCRAHLSAPWRYRYRVLALPGGRFDLVRDRVEQVRIQNWGLAVPFEIPFHDPGRPCLEGTKRGGSKTPETGSCVNAELNGRIILRDLEKPISIEIDHEPRGFRFDGRGEVLARFWSESERPRRALTDQAAGLAAEGRIEEAETTYRKALDAPSRIDTVGAAEDPKAVESESRFEEGVIRIGLARLSLDRGQIEAARREIDRAGDLIEGWRRWSVDGERVAIEARIDLAAGEPGSAYRKLKRGIRNRGIDSAEDSALLAIAARASGHDTEYARALDEARRHGVDVSALDANR